MLTWEELVELEPRLLDLERKIREGGPNTTKKWITIYKPLLCRLIGQDRQVGPEVLQTSKAYDVAYDHLYNVHRRRNRR